jgi:hypothetical protein
MPRSKSEPSGMTEQNDRDLDRVRLPEDAARRLIARATELDARLATESSIADLRDAARQAGISNEAFQRALDEARSGSAHSAAAKRSASLAPHRYVRVAIILLIVGVLALVATRLIPSPPTPAAPQGSVAVPAPSQVTPLAPLPSPVARPVVAKKKQQPKQQQ